MFVRGERVDTLRRPKAAPPPSGRPRYCRRCGGPLGLSAFAMNGVRCLSCGAQPGLASPTNAAAAPPRDYAMPRPHTSITVMSETAPQRQPPTQARPRPRAAVRDAELRAWMRDFSPPSIRTVITIAVAGFCGMAGITLAMALG